MYKVEIPRRVTKQLDKIPRKDYPSVSKAIHDLEKTPRPQAAKNWLNPFTVYAPETFESSTG